MVGIPSTSSNRAIVGNDPLPEHMAMTTYTITAHCAQCLFQWVAPDNDTGQAYIKSVCEMHEMFHGHKPVKTHKRTVWGGNAQMVMLDETITEGGTGGSGEEPND